MPARPGFDERDMMLQAYAFAAHSPDPSTQNSAVLLTPNNMEPIIMAFNYVPEKLQHVEGIYERPKKYDYILHAEENAIITAAVNGIKTKGLVMFAPWAACKHCARVIIGAQIAEVWTHTLEEAHNQWNEEVSVGLRLLKEAGVELHIIDGKLDPENRIQIRRNGKLISP